MILKVGGLVYEDMGYYIFVNGNGDLIWVDYIFGYYKLNGKVLILL